MDLQTAQNFLDTLVLSAQSNVRVWIAMLMAMSMYGLLAAFTNVGSNIPYIVSICRNPEIRPSSSTWMIWGTLDAARAYIMYIEGKSPYQMTGSVIGIILILAFGLWKRKLIGWSWVDYLVAAGVGGVMYATFVVSGGSNFWMLVASLAALTVGALPMYWKTILDPRSEPVIPWVMVWLACWFQIKSSDDMSFFAIGVSCWIMFLTTLLLITIGICLWRLGKKETATA